MTNSKTPGVGSTGGLEGTAGWLAENEDTRQPQPSPTPRVDWNEVRTAHHRCLGESHLDICPDGLSALKVCECGAVRALLVVRSMPACDHSMDLANDAMWNVEVTV